MIKKLSLALALAALAAFGLAACGSSSSSSSTTQSSTTATGTATGGGTGGTGGSSSGGGSTINVSADPSGALAFQQKTLTANAGNDTIAFTNMSSTGHNVTIEDANAKDVGATNTISGSSTTTTVNLKPGIYTFYCSVDSHEQAGMKGTLTVK